MFYLCHKQMGFTVGIVRWLLTNVYKAIVGGKSLLLLLAVI